VCRMGFFSVAGRLEGRSLNRTVKFTISDLSEEERLKTESTNDLPGYMPYGQRQARGIGADLKESYMISLDLPLTDPWFRLVFRCMDRPMAFLRTNTSTCCRRLYKHMWTRLWKDLRFVLRYLGTDAFFFEQWFTKLMVQTRLLIHHPLQNVDSKRGALGAAPHTDYGMLIVLLVQDPWSRVEETTVIGSAIPYLENTFIVSHRGPVSSLVERLVCLEIFFIELQNKTGSSSRFQRFFQSWIDTPVACPPVQCMSDMNPAKYPPVKAGDYIVQRFRDARIQRLLPTAYRLHQSPRLFR